MDTATVECGAATWRMQIQRQKQRFHDVTVCVGHFVGVMRLCCSCQVAATATPSDIRPQPWSTVWCVVGLSVRLARVRGGVRRT